MEEATTYNVGCYQVMEDGFLSITCPYCGETGEIYVEPDVDGELIQDCEVCCNPWLVEIGRAGGIAVVVRVTRADGSE